MADAVCAQLRHGPRGDHAGCRLSRSEIQAGNARMRARRAHEHEPALARKVEVVAIATLAGEEALVLEPFLGARSAEARRGRIELHLQGDGAHGPGILGTLE